MEIFKESEETKEDKAVMHLWVACFGNKFHDLCGLVEDSLNITSEKSASLLIQGNKRKTYKGNMNNTIYEIIIGYGAYPSIEGLYPHLITVSRSNKDNDELANKIKEEVLKYKGEAEGHIKSRVSKKLDSNMWLKDKFESGE